MKNRKIWVDYAKALGITLVVIGHVNRGLMNARIDTNTHISKMIDNYIYSFHMPLFFFLAALFFSKSFERSGPSSFVANKAKVLLYPYIIWSLLQGGIEVLLSHYTNTKTDISDVINLFQPRAQFWFLYALFMVFMVSLLLRSISNNKRVDLFILLLSLCLYLVKNNLTNNYHLNYVTNNLFFFYLGIVAVDYRENISKIKINFVVAFTSLLAFLALCYYFHNINHINLERDVLASLILALAGIFTCISISLSLSEILESKTLLLIGELSMPIYLLHIIAGSGTRVMLTKLTSLTNYHIHLLLGLLAGIVIPIIIYKISKKYHFMFLFEFPSFYKDIPISKTQKY
ncbi:acyltransferase family protein [Sodalis sp. RH20]|uniref:acyltransferase family protein n=1 Tax=unclassified Sodalis (in: enterobacteria) TaxID=2636512 RepID=UPI0039B4FEF3